MGTHACDKVVHKSRENIVANLWIKISHGVFRYRRMGFNFLKLVDISKTLTVRWRSNLGTDLILYHLYNDWKNFSFYYNGFYSISFRFVSPPPQRLFNVFFAFVCFTCFSYFDFVALCTQRENNNKNKPKRNKKMYLTHFGRAR